MVGLQQKPVYMVFFPRLNLYLGSSNWYVTDQLSLAGTWRSVSAAKGALTRARKKSRHYVDSSNSAHHFVSIVGEPSQIQLCQLYNNIQSAQTA